MDSGKLEKVIVGLEHGDISECLVSDVKHASEVLAKVAFLNHMKPGMMDELFDIFIPQFIKQHNREMLGEMAQKRADSDGFGDEWRDAINAGKSPLQKDFVAKMVTVYMKATGVNQNAAIRAAAEQLGRDEDNIRRTVTRAKKRGKK
jgi:hypothetical protein